LVELEVMMTRAACALALSLLPCPVAATAPPAARPERPSIVLILADDLGYGDLGCYGAPDIRTPHLDRLARDGVRLTQGYANGPVCTPTRAALMTGRWQQRVGLEWALFANQKELGLPVDEPSLARMLKESGYATGLFGKWHLGGIPDLSPNAHGFDAFFGLLGGNVDMYSHRIRNGAPDLWEDGRAIESAGYLTDLITDRAIAFIERQRERPFFAYVAYNAVHWPFQAPGRPDDVRTPETWESGTRADYAGMTESMDAGIGRILAALERQGLASSTLVVFTSDNGGERLSRMAPLFNRKHSLWEGGVRVPCILRWPGRLPRNRTVEQPVISMDLTASILAAAGARPPAGRTLDGMDVLPILAGHAAPAERTFFWRVDRKERRQKAVRKGRWKYVLDAESELLFDVVADPAEREDLAYGYPAVLAELRGLLKAWEDEMAKEKPRFVVK
jgi:arylsulfatase A-like enzyme